MTMTTTIGEQKMPRTRKIVMTVFCLEEDADDVKAELVGDKNNQIGWFFESEYPLSNIKVEVLEPTPEEDRQTCENLDVELDEEIDPSDWTVEDCVNFIEAHFGKDVLAAAMLEISTDDVEGWRNEVRRRMETE
jgi:hypothetical protein